MRMFLIMNPGSRGGRSGRLFNGILSTLQKSAVDFDHTVTSSLEDISASSATACRDGYDVVVSVGGDGTINRVVNGFYDDSGKLISNSRFGVIYTGTSPDFCRSYQIPDDAEGALSTLLSGCNEGAAPPRAIPVGRIQLALKHDSAAEDQITRYFCCCANIGLGARVAANANSVRKLLGDHFGTFLGLLRAVAATRPVDLPLTRDGNQELLGNMRNLSIGLTRYIASGIKVEHQLSEQDDRFYTLAAHDVTLVSLPGILRDLYRGGELASSSLSLEYARTLDIPGGPQPVEVEFDGDPAGFLPCRVELARDRLPLIGSRYEN
jgi:diacylglycerol kinase family enzyme